MDRKRKNIPAGIRWNVFQRDDFRCVYCGWARKDGADLVVDHGDPFSKGGADDLSNYVTACKPCNDGKKAKIVIPPAAELDGATGGVVRRGVLYKNSLHADWADAFRQCSFSVDYLATIDCQSALRTVRPMTGGEECVFSILRLDFRVEFHAFLTVGTNNVVIVPNSDAGCFSERDKLRIRDAVILGYREPTAIIIGSPWMFYGAVVNKRHKGCPAGFTLNEYLHHADDFLSSGWYPDENWHSFYDPRDEFGLRPTSLKLRGWHTTIQEVMAMSQEDYEARYGL